LSEANLLASRSRPFALPPSRDFRPVSVVKIIFPWAASSFKKPHLAAFKRIYPHDRALTCAPFRPFRRSSPFGRPISNLGCSAFDVGCSMFSLPDSWQRGSARNGCPKSSQVKAKSKEVKGWLFYTNHSPGICYNQKPAQRLRFPGEPLFLNPLAFRLYTSRPP